MTDRALCLIGDLGATKVLLTRLPLDGPSRGFTLPESTSFESQRFDCLEAILSAFLNSSEPPRPTRAVFAVAGPVIDRRSQITNLPWIVDADQLAERFAFDEVVLMNDLEALAYAVPVLGTDQSIVLHEGQPEPGGAMAVLAPGTGLGEAYLTTEASGDYTAHASEGGHADFAPADPRQDRLLAFLRGEIEHVSVERVASGMGLPNLYRFVREVEKIDERPDIARALSTAGDLTPIIIEAATTGRSPACVAAVRLLAEILAAEAGNLALKVLATGGVYLGGGIPPRIQAFLRAEAFTTALLRKGRFRSFMQRVRISMILDSLSVLRGAAVRARRKNPAHPTES
jgi:glucokinase